MVHSIGPSDSTVPASSSQTPEERQKMFELQFQTAVIGDYVAVSDHNGSMQQQLSKLKHGLATGQPPDQLASNLNLLISQVNNTISPGKATFPPFSFSTSGSQTQAVTHFAISLEKLLHTAAEKGTINWSSEQKLFGDLTGLINSVGQITPEQAFLKLNGIIDEANSALPSQYKLPKISPLSKR